MYMFIECPGFLPSNALQGTIPYRFRVKIHISIKNLTNSALKKSYFHEGEKTNFLKRSTLIFKILLCSGLHTAALNNDQQDKNLNLCSFILLLPIRNAPSLSSIRGKGQFIEIEVFHVDNQVLKSIQMREGIFLLQTYLYCVCNFQGKPDPRNI